MPASIITNAGLAKIRTAAGSASQVAITHVAIGDGNGANYNPLFTNEFFNSSAIKSTIEHLN